jgi:hypothetical protein
MASVDGALAPIEEVASDPTAAKAKSKKEKVPKEKKPRAPPSHPPYAEVCSFALSLSQFLEQSIYHLLSKIYRLYELHLLIVSTCSFNI